MAKGAQSAADLFSAYDNFGSKGSNGGGASESATGLMDSFDKFDGGTKPKKPALPQVAQNLIDTQNGFDEQHPILSKILDFVQPRTATNTLEQVAAAGPDVIKQLTTPIDDVVKPSGDRTIDRLAKANESVKRVGRITKDVATDVFSPISVLLSPLNPEIEKIGTMAQNVTKLLVPGQSTVRPEVANKSFPEIVMTPGAVTTGNENADAIYDELGPAAVMALLGDVVKPGVKPGTIPSEVVDAVRAGKHVTAAEEGPPSAATLAKRKSPTKAAQVDAQAAYSAAKPVNLPYELKNSEPTLVEGKPETAQTLIVSKPEGPKSARQAIVGGDIPEPTGETPAAQATRELADRERGFSIEDKRRVVPEEMPAKKAAEPDLSRPAVPDESTLKGGEGKPLNIDVTKDSGDGLKPGDTVPPQLLASDAGKTLKANLTRRGLDFDANGVVVETRDADLETIRKASTGETPDVAVEHEPPKYTGEQATPFNEGERVAGVDGKPTTVRVPGRDKGDTAKYRVIELDSLQPSHNGGTLAPNDAYGLKNDRMYHTDKVEQSKVIANEQKFDPSEVINTAPTADVGPPIVTPNGRALGGNSRSMTLQRLYGNGRGDIYKNYLADNAGTFGLDEAQVRGMKQPVLVREVESPKTVGEGQQRITDYNRPSAAALNPTARAVSIGSKLTDASVGRIAGMLEDLGTPDKPGSVAELLRSRPKEMLELLRKDGAIAENQINQFVEQGESGQAFTDDAKSVIGDALLGHVLGDADLIARMSPSLKNKLEVVLPETISLKGRGPDDPWNLTNIVKQAVDDHRLASQANMPVDDYYRQGGMFSQTDNPLVEAMARKLTENQKAIKASFRQFFMDSKMDTPGQGMLGIVQKIEPNQAFAEAFGGDALKPEQYGDARYRAWVERNGGPPAETTMSAGFVPLNGIANVGRKIAGKGPEQIPVADAKLNEIREVQDAPKQQPMQWNRDALTNLGKEVSRRYYDQFTDWRDLVKQLNKNGVRLLPLENPDMVFDIVFGSTGAKLQKQAILMKRIVKDATGEGLRDNLQGYLNLAGYQRAYDLLNENLAGLRADEAKLTRERAAGRTEIQQGTKAAVRTAKELSGSVDDLASVKQQIKEIEERISNGKVVPKFASESEVQAAIGNMRQALGPGKFAKVQLYAQRVFDLNRKAWDMAHDSGIVADNIYAQGVARGPEYIPLERIMEQTEANRQARFSGLDLRTQKILRRLEGSELTNVDPFSASLNRIAETIREVERNKSAKVAVSSLEKLNQFQPNSVYELKHGASAPHDMGVIGYFEDGKVRRFAAPKMLADSLELADATQRQATAHVVLSLGRKLFRTGATGANVFWSVFNVAKDQADAFQLAKMNLKTPMDVVRFEKDWFQNAYNVLRKNDAYLGQLDRGYLASTMQRAIDPQHFLELQKTGFKGRLGDLTIGKIEDINNAFEEATKITVYQRLINQGWDPTEAAIETRRFGGSPDFARAGYDRSLDLAVMFLNANVQGLARAAKRGFGIKQNPAVFAGITGGLLAMMANNMSYTRKDGSREYEHIPDIDKQNYWNLILPYTYQTTQGETKHGVWKVPKGHTAQLLFNPMEQLVYQAMARKPDVSALALETTNSFLPGAIELEKGKLASSFTRGVVGSLNPVLKVPLEELGNTNTLTGGPIVPARMENLAPTEQFRDTTSPTAKAVGNLINKIPGVEGAPILRNLASPLRIEHALRGTLAGVGDQILAVFDAAQPKPKDADLREADEKFAHLPMVGGFTRRMVGSTQDQEVRDKEETFYDLTGKAKEARATFDSIAAKEPERAKQWLLQDPERLVLAAMNGHLGEQSKLLAKIRSASDTIANDQAIPAEQRKRALAKLFDARVEVLKQNDDVEKLVEQASQKIKERKGK